MRLHARTLVMAGSAAALALALALVAYDANPFGYWLACIAGIAFLGSLFERFRYKKLADQHPGPGWVATEERFIDPETNRPVTVFYNPRNGERMYVAEQTAPHPIGRTRS